MLYPLAKNPGSLLLKTDLQGFVCLKSSILLLQMMTINALKRFFSWSEYPIVKDFKIVISRHAFNYFLNLQLRMRLQTCSRSNEWCSNRNCSSVEGQLLSLINRNGSISVHCQLHDSSLFFFQGQLHGLLEEICPLIYSIDGNLWGPPMWWGLWSLKYLLCNLNPLRCACIMLIFAFTFRKNNMCSNGLKI